MIRMVFFDLDDTLVDTSVLAEKARKQAITNMIRAGMPVSPDEAYSELIELIREYGSNFPHHFDYLLRRLELPHNPKWIAAGVIGYHNTKFTYLNTVRGVRKTLLRLREMGIKLGVITDGNPVKQWEKILRTEIDDYFDTVVISDFLGVKKPHKKIFEKALDCCKAKAGEAVMVGDRLYTDIYGAKSVGMVTIWFRYGKHVRDDVDYISYADFTVEDIRKVPEIIRGLNNEDSE